MTPDSTKTEALYFRATPELKKNAEEFANGQALTLSAALGLLVQRGLEAIGDEASVERLQATARDLRNRLSEADMELAQRAGVIEGLRERDRKWSAAFAGIEGQLRTIVVGRCTACGGVVTSYDLAWTRICPAPACGRALQGVTQGGDSNPAFAALIGGVAGLVLGLAAGSGSQSEQTDGGSTSHATRRGIST